MSMTIICNGCRQKVLLRKFPGEHWPADDDADALRERVAELEGKLDELNDSLSIALDNEADLKRWIDGPQKSDDAKDGLAAGEEK